MSLDQPREVIVRLPSIAEVGSYPVPDGPRLLRQGGREVLNWDPHDMTAASLQHLARSPAGACLGRFVMLGEAPTVDILTFAHMWGPLGPVAVICDPTNDEPDLAEMLWYEPPGHSNDTHMPPEVLATIGGSYEPVDGWRAAARWVTAILSAVAALTGDSPLSTAERTAAIGVAYRDVKREYPDYVRPVLEDGWDTESQVDSDRFLVSVALQYWFQYAHFALGVRWRLDSGDYPRLVMPGPPWGGLPYQLGLELISTATSPTGIYRCDSCGRSYSPVRRARADRQRFCPDCSQGRSKAAKRAYYHRKKAGSLDG